MGSNVVHKLLGVAGKTAFITGGASGIGLATAELFLECGMKVAIADQNRAALKEVLSRFSDFGSDTLRTFHCNVCIKEEVEGAVADCLTWSDGVDSLVTCAGIVRPDNGSGIYDTVLDVNLRGTLHAVDALRDNFRKKQGGTVVMIGSIVASHGWAGRVIYCASKGAVEGAMRAVAMEFAGFHSRVNAIAPGLCWTPLMAEVVRRSPNPETAFRFRSAQQALGKMLAPEEVARHILFLSSDLSAGIVGATIDASGGRLAGHVPDVNNPGPLFADAWEAVKNTLQT